MIPAKILAKSWFLPALQDGKKIPKWDSKARQGIFVGFSDEHSSLAPLVFNPTTQHISPQYNVIFNDKFTTVPSLYSVDAAWKKLFELEKDEWFVEEDVIGKRTIPQAAAPPVCNPSVPPPTRLHQREVRPDGAVDLDDDPEGEIPTQPTVQLHQLCFQVEIHLLPA
jgi:hypothetical protein